MKYSYGLNSARRSAKSLRKATIVCVTNQFQCERIIKAGRVIANISNTELLVVNVSPTDFKKQNVEAIQFLFNISKENDAEMSVFYSDEPLKALVSFIKQNRAVNVVTGMPQVENSLLNAVWNKFTHISFFTVNEDGGFSDITRRNIKPETA